MSCTLQEAKYLLMRWQGDQRTPHYQENQVRVVWPVATSPELPALG